MTETANKLRAWANAHDSADVGSSYLIDVLHKSKPPKSDFGVVVQWSWGRNNPGYEEVRLEVEQQVKDMMPELLQEAGNRIRNSYISTEARIKKELSL